MTSHLQRRDHTPPPPDEDYWAALLHEGEFSATAYTNHDIEDHRVFSNGNGADHLSHSNGYSNGHHISSLQDWHEIAAVMQRDEVIELTVISYNRGGLLVEWKTINGFVPASQLLNHAPNGSAVNRQNALAALVGQQLRLRVIELNEEQNRLILSERAARVAPGERANILTRLKPGDTITGFITNLTDFGAFVDLGGLEGLIHISELSWGRVGHPADLLKRGQEVRVYVLDVDRGAGRIALSMKRLSPDPWATVEKRYAIGQIVEGTITNVVDFGAFACIEEGLEGLIHVSEMAEGHFLHPRNVVSEGEHIRARVLSIDAESRRLGLTLRLKE